MTCSECLAPLTGRQTRYCSPQCRMKGFTRDRIADGRLREYRKRPDVRERQIDRKRQVSYTQTFSCERCGNEHTNRRGEQGRYCSKRCSRPATAKRPPAPKREPVAITRACNYCEATFQTVWTTRWYCSRTCRQRLKEQRRRTREEGSFGEWRWSDFMRVARRFNYCCAYCGEKPDRLDPDHVTPLSRGGLNVIGNLLPACTRCNSSKGALTLAEWEAERGRRHQPPRATSWSNDDSRYFHLTATQALAA